MSEKTITAANGKRVTVETDKKILGFQAGDIVTEESYISSWHDERVVIEGVCGEGNLWGTIAGKEKSQYTVFESGLILLERPSWKYKVGDRVMLDGKQATVVVLNPDAERGRHLIKYRECRHGHNGSDAWNKKWFPKHLKITDRDDLWWCDEERLESMEVGSQASQSSALVASTEKKEEVLELHGQIPEWMQEVIINYKAGNNCFILHGNIHDIYKNESGKSLSIHQFLSETFGQRLAIFYSLSGGVQFVDKEAEKKFKDMISGSKPAQSQSASQGTSNAVAQAQQQFSQAMSEAPLEKIIGGKSPDVVFPLLSKILSESEEKKVVIIDNCHNVAPSIQSQSMAERAIVETLEHWGRNAKIKEAGNVIILLSTFDISLAECLRSLHSGYKAIKISKPSESERSKHWESSVIAKEVELEEGIDIGVLGRITNGLSLRDIEQICALAKARQSKLAISAVKERKRDILKNEFGDLIKIKDPEFGFDYFGGKENVKEFMLEIRDNISKGILRRVPMGLLASGPPGTGKTFFFECWAYECGFNFVQIENPRNMWVGKSEENMLKIFAALDAIAPVVVIEDEADQSETSRDVPNGDSGVSSRLRKMKFEFCSDPARRGKVIWVRISNRADLIDIAYKRKGRTDDSIPFILPLESEYKEIFKVMFDRYKIPTDITDFSEYTDKVAQKVYCVGADVEWIAREADQYAGRENKEKVEKEHLLRAIDDWEMATDPREVDRQIIQAIRGSSRRLRPDNWEKILVATEARLGKIDGAHLKMGSTGSIHPDFEKARC